MAWYTPKHACGHDGERIQLYGKEDGRQRILGAMNRKDCPDCALGAALREDEAMGLPALSGSTKQITWASQIRREFLRDNPRQVADHILSERAASWWIEHRGPALRETAERREAARAAETK